MARNIENKVKKHKKNESKDLWIDRNMTVEGREEEGECPLQRGQKTLNAVTLTLNERDRGKKNRQKKAERALRPV